MPAPWLVLPTFNEAENLERLIDERARACSPACAPEGFAILVVDDGLARRDRRDRRPPRRRARRGRGPAPADARGARPRLPGGLPPRARRRRRLRLRDGQRLLARPGRPRAAARRRARRRRRRRARLALRATAAASATGALLRRFVSRGGSRLRAARARPAGARPDRRLQVLPRARCSRRSTSPTVRSRGYAFQVELDLPRGARAAFASSRCRSRSATASTAARRCRGAIALEAIWLVPALRLRRSGRRDGRSAAEADEAAPHRAVAHDLVYARRMQGAANALRGAAGRGQHRLPGVRRGPDATSCVPGLASHLDLAWSDPDLTRLWKRPASFARVIVYDKPGTGLSDPIMRVPTLEERRDDIRIVLDAAGSERTALLGFSEGGPTCAAFRCDGPRARRVAGPLTARSHARTPARRSSTDPTGSAAYERSRAALNDLEANWGQGKSLDDFAPSVAEPAAALGLRDLRAGGGEPGDGEAADRGLAEDRCPRRARRGRRANARSAPRRGSRSRVQRAAARGRDPRRGAQGSSRPRPHVLGQRLRGVGERDRALPTGSAGAASPERALATILFTDIVGSTERASKLGDSAWRQLLERHDRRRCESGVAEERGRVVKSLGDGTMAVFDGRRARSAPPKRSAMS